jgi:hypothetical protein
LRDVALRYSLQANLKAATVKVNRKASRQTEGVAVTQQLLIDAKKFHDEISPTLTKRVVAKLLTRILNEIHDEANS